MKAVVLRNAQREEDKYRHNPQPVLSSVLFSLYTDTLTSYLTKFQKYVQDIAIGNSYILMTTSLSFLLHVVPNMVMYFVPKFLPPTPHPPVLKVKP